MRHFRLPLLALALSWQAPAMAQHVAPQAAWFNCLIQPDTLVDVGFPAWGVVADVAVERGDFVEEGQLIAALESGVEEATVRINRARHQFAERKRLRTLELAASSSISNFDVDQAETESELALLELQRSEETLQQRQIRSPINGFVVERMVSVGEYVQESPVLQLADIDPLRVEVVLPVGWFGKIALGDQAMVRPENSAEEFAATVTIVDRLIDAASGTLGVSLELSNPDNRLPAGLKCQVRFAP